MGTATNRATRQKNCCPLTETGTVMRINVLLALVWAYQGLVPKLLGPAPLELTMNRALGLGTEAAILLARIAGFAELGMAACLLVFAHHRWPLQLTIAGAIALLLYVAVLTPGVLLAAFNPVTTNALMAGLAWEGLRRQDQ